MPSTEREHDSARTWCTNIIQCYPIHGSRARSNSALMISFVKDKWDLTRAIIARLIDVFDCVNYTFENAFSFMKNVWHYRWQFSDILSCILLNTETNYSFFYFDKNIENSLHLPIHRSSKVICVCRNFFNTITTGHWRQLRLQKRATMHETSKGSRGPISLQFSFFFRYNLWSRVFFRDQCLATTRVSFPLYWAMFRLKTATSIAIQLFHK